MNQFAYSKGAANTTYNILYILMHHFIHFRHFRLFSFLYRLKSYPKVYVRLLPFVEPVQQSRDASLLVKILIER